MERKLPFKNACNTCTKWLNTCRKLQRRISLYQFSLHASFVPVKAFSPYCSFLIFPQMFNKNRNYNPSTNSAWNLQQRTSRQHDGEARTEMRRSTYGDEEG